jgi:hypothetical protein
MMRLRIPFGLLAAVVFGMLSLTACSAGGSSVPSQTRTTKDIPCTEPMTAGRSTQSVRSAQDDCNNDGYGDPTWDTSAGDPGFTFDNPNGDLFYAAQDQYGNPCPPGDGTYAVIGCVGAKAGQYYFVIANITPAAGPAQVAMPGGIAQRGDNCTTSPNLAVGYPVPGGATTSTNGQPLGPYNNAATITNQDAVQVTYQGAQNHRLSNRDKG